jgi:hypothetical protein
VLRKRGEDRHRSKTLLARVDAAGLLATSTACAAQTFDGVGLSNAGGRLGAGCGNIWIGRQVCGFGDEDFAIY